MSAQLENLQQKRKVRYAIPTYKKIYSAYVYDQPKYNKIFKKIQQLALKYDEEIFKRTERYRVLRLCYVRENGKLQLQGDEKHIFRYKTLDNILCKIAEVLLQKYNLLPQKDVLSYLYSRTKLALYIREDYCQAELLTTFRQPLRLRIHANIMLLRYLRLDLEIEDAVTLTNRCIKHFEEKRYKK